MSPEARVGLATLVAFILILGVIVFLRSGEIVERGYDLNIVFRNAGGLTVGGKVQMAGVEVGRVKRVFLDPSNRAIVTITVRSDVRVPEGSQFQVTTAGVVGDRNVSIVPGPMSAPPLKPNSISQGQEPFTLESLTARFNDIADRVESVVDSVNRLVADPELQDRLRRSLANVEQTTATARDAARAAEQAARNTERATAGVQALLDREAPILVHNLRQMSVIVLATATQLQAFVSTASGDGALARDLRATVASARATAQRLDRMTKDLQGLVNADNVATARQTLEEAQAAVHDARALVRMGQDIADRARGTMQRLPGSSSLDRRRLLRLDYDVWYAQQRGGHDLALTFLPESQRFYRLGVHDIGAMNGIVLQVGQRLDTALAIRAGIFESQVGIGLDYRVLAPATLSVDLYNINQPTVDAVLRYRVQRSWQISLGGKNLLRQPSFLIGIGFSY